MTGYQGTQVGDLVPGYPGKSGDRVLAWPPIGTGLISDILGNSTAGETYHRRIWKNDKFSIISRKISNFKIFS